MTTRNARATATAGPSASLRMTAVGVGGKERQRQERNTGSVRSAQDDGGWGGSAVEEVHGFLEAGVHAIEGAGDLGDFVVAANGELREAHFALADAVGGGGDDAERADDDEVEADVDEGDGEEEDGGEIEQEFGEAAAGEGEWDGGGDGDDLGSDDFAEVPAEAVLGTVVFEHGAWGGGRLAVALEATLLDADGVGEIEADAGGVVAGAGELGLGGGVAEVVDDVGLPVGGAVAEVGWVERGLLVGVVGEGLADLSEGFFGGEEGDGLGKEIGGVLDGFLEEGGDVGFGVVAGGGGAGGHEGGFAEDLGLGLLLEEGAGFEGDEQKAEAEDGEEQDVEFDE